MTVPTLQIFKLSDNMPNNNYNYQVMLFIKQKNTTWTE